MRFFQDCQTIDEVKKRYKSLAKEHHPDKGGDTAGRPHTRRNTSIQRQEPVITILIHNLKLNVMKNNKITFTAVGPNYQNIIVTGIKYEVPELPEFTFVLHKHLGYPKSFVLSEVSTGMMFTYPGTKKEQSSFIQKRIESFGIPKIKEIITSQVGKYNTL